jgi:predicted PurR-regulated permease PerM
MNPMKVRIEIDTKTFVRFWLVVVGFFFAIVALYSARAALLILGIAAFLALALNGPVSRLARRLPDRSRTLSTAIAFTIVVALLAAVIFLVVPPIVEQTMKFVDGAPAMVDEVSQQWKGLGQLIEQYHLQAQIDQAIEAMKADAGRWAATFGGNIVTSVGSAFAFIAAALLTLVLTFLMLVEGPVWADKLWRLYKDKSRMKHHRKIARRMSGVVSGYVGGQLTVSGINALCAGAVVFILSQFFREIPANLALPTIAIAFTLSLIPMFGATIAGVIITALLAFNSIPAAIIFAVYFMVYQQLENNLISPTIQAKRIELSPLIVLVAVTIGLYTAGIVGGIVSIPIAGCIKVLVEEYLASERRQERDTK